MKKPYRFLGTKGQILDTPYEFSQFGQLVSIEPELAASNRMLVPATDFDSIGFTPDELKKYADPSTHDKATDSFLAKKDKALLLLNKPADEVVPVKADLTEKKKEVVINA